MATTPTRIVSSTFWLTGSVPGQSHCTESDPGQCLKVPHLFSHCICNCHRFDCSSPLVRFILYSWIVCCTYIATQDPLIIPVLVVLFIYNTYCGDFCFRAARTVTSLLGKAQFIQVSTWITTSSRAKYAYA